MSDMSKDELPTLVIRETESDADESAVEWKYVRHALEAGVTPTEVYQRLLEHCLTRRGRDAKRYAETTVKKACAKGGIAFH